jgi:hypothetical protein
MTQGQAYLTLAIIAVCALAWIGWLISRDGKR